MAGIVKLTCLHHYHLNYHRKTTKLQDYSFIYLPLQSHYLTTFTVLFILTKSQGYIVTILITTAKQLAFNITIITAAKSQAHTVTA